MLNDEDALIEGLLICKRASGFNMYTCDDSIRVRTIGVVAEHDAFRLRDLGWYEHGSERDDWYFRIQCYRTTP